MRQPPESRMTSATCAADPVGCSSRHSDGARPLLPAFAFRGRRRAGARLTMRKIVARSAAAPPSSKLAAPRFAPFEAWDANLLRIPNNSNHHRPLSPPHVTLKVEDLL